MAGALGFAIGTGLSALGGYAAEKAQQKQQHEAMWDNFMLSNLNKNPEFAQTPQGQKEIKRLYGEHADAAQAMLGLAAQGKKQFAQDLAGGGAQPQPQGGVVQAAAKPGQVDGAAGQDKVGAIQAQIDRMMQLRAKYADDPQKAAIIDEHLKELQAERGQVQHDQEFQESRADRAQMHADIEQDKAAQRQIQAENAKAMQAIASMNAETHAAIGQMNANIAEGRAKEAQQKDFDTAKQSLQKQFQAIVAAKTGGPNKPAMNAKQLDPLIARYNAQARALLARGKKAGVDFDPDEFQPIKADDITTHPWYKLGLGTDTTTELSNADGGSAPAGGSGAAPSVDDLVKKYGG